MKDKITKNLCLKELIKNYFDPSKRFSINKQFYNILSPRSHIFYSVITGRGLAEGHKGRLAEFERFEVKLNECLSSSAIRTKFEQHHSRGTEIVQELEELLRSEDQFIVQKR